MRNFVVSGYLLAMAAIMLLMNQQAMLVEAKPFLLPPRSFFILTTQAPCTSTRTTNCNSSPRPGASSRPQTYDLLAPKIRILQSIFQSFMRGGSSSGGSSTGGGLTGGIGFAFNKFNILSPTTTSTTTTSSPGEFTEPESIFTPDSGETSTTATTTAGPGSSSEVETKPGYSYENGKNEASGSISVSAKTPSGSISTNIAVSNRLGEDNSSDEKDGKASSLNGNGYNDKGYKYEESKKIVATTSAPDSSIESSSTPSTSANSSGYQYTQSTSTQSSGYQYGKPAENEVSR